jgi:hypothetical protein
LILLKDFLELLISPRSEKLPPASKRSAARRSP